MKGHGLGRGAVVPPKHVPPPPWPLSAVTRCVRVAHSPWLPGASWHFPFFVFLSLLTRLLGVQDS
eukprot:3336180-Amphidinium_carterae.1